MDSNMLLTLLPLLMGNQGGNPNADMFSKVMQMVNPSSPPPGVPPKTCAIKRDDAQCYPPPRPPYPPCPPPPRPPYPPCPPPPPSPYPPCPPPPPQPQPPYPPCPPPPNPPYPQPRPYNQPYYPGRPYDDYQRAPYPNQYYNPYGSRYTQGKAEIPKQYQYPPLPAGDLSVESVMGVFDMMTNKE